MVEGQKDRKRGRLDERKRKKCLLNDNKRFLSFALFLKADRKLGCISPEEFKSTSVVSLV